MSLEIFTGLDSNTLVAYLDPGMGSMQFQILVAGILSAGFFLKASFIQVKDRLGRILRPKN